MKILTSNVQPTMIIRKAGNRYKSDYLLVTAVSKGTNIEITGFPSLDSYYGRVIQSFACDEKVKVLKNKRKQKKILENILHDAFEHMHHAEEDVDLLKLMKRFI